METDRWRLLERLCHTALELEPGRRGAYLQEVCGSDESLRQELESLLAREERAQSFIEEPALHMAARELAANPTELAVGQTIDRYRILDRIGAGGMGIVYSAHDSRLGRTVALKFLPDEFIGDRDALQRFGREFRALSALNHPNICTIYDSGEVDGRTFISMEYVAGKTLDRRIGRKGLPLQEALKYAVQIAGALAKAHGEGIIHRDLKPGNIMVSDDGHIKLLDFGLAKLTETPKQGDSTDTVMPRDTPTTMRGTIVGTAAYMSPEQATGRDISVRSDIFSFGAVLYEMITGRRSFTGENDISTLSAVLNNDPTPITSIAPSTPRELERIVARCLRKDPERRFQNAADLKIALQEIKEEAESGKLAAAVPVSRRPWLPATIATGALLLVASLVWLSRVRSPAKAQNLVITRFTADSGLTTTPAISSDGRLVVYASDRSGDSNLDLWVQQVAGGPPNRLTNNPSDDTLPDFSPDGSKIAFVSQRDGGGIYIVSTLGGEERLVAKTGSWTSRPRFSPDGSTIAYSVISGIARIYIVSSTGGPSRALKLSVPWATHPIWSPDGKKLLFVGNMDPSGFGEFDWWVADAEGGLAVKSGALDLFAKMELKPPPESPGELSTLPSSWTGNRIVFISKVGDSSNLWRAAIKPNTWQIVDPPERLTTGAEQELYASLAADGHLVFATVAEHLNLWTMSIDANKGKVEGSPRPVSQVGANSTRPSLSADGRKMVFESDLSGNVDIWMRDTNSGKERPLTSTPWNETHPSISPDGSKVFYASQDGLDAVIHLVNLGTGADERLCEDCGMPMTWFPDNRRILYYFRAQPIRYGSVDIVTGKRAEVLHHPKFNLHMARFFGDGNWLTFHVPMLQQESASPIYVTPVRSGVAASESEWIQVTDGRGIDATPWPSPDGSILYFLSKRDGFQCIWAQHLDAATKRPKGPPFNIAHFHGARRNLRQVGFGPGAAGGRLVFTMSDSIGNIWITKIEPSK